MKISLTASIEVSSTKRVRSSSRITSAAMATAALLMATTAFGANQYWDTNGSTSGVGGTGTWDTSSLFWNSSSSGTSSAAAWTNFNTAYFGTTASGITTTAGTVTVSSSANVQVDNITFYTTGFTIAGGPLGLNSSLIKENSASTETISATLAGSTGVTFAGSSTGYIFNVTGANTYTGTTVLQGVTFNFNTLANAGTNTSFGNTGDVLLGGSSTVDAKLNTLLSYGGLGAASTTRLFGFDGSNTITIQNNSDNTNGGALTFANTNSAVGGVAGVRTIALGGSYTTTANTFTEAIGDTGTSANITNVQITGGTWILNGANSYSGTTTVSGGVTLVGTGQYAFGNSSSVSITGTSFLDLFNNASTSYQGTTGVGDIVTITSSGATVDVDSASSAYNSVAKTMSLGQVNATNTSKTGVTFKFTGADNSSLSITSMSGSQYQSGVTATSNTIQNTISGGGTLTIGSYTSGSLQTVPDTIAFTGTGNTIVSGAVANDATATSLGLTYTGSAGSLTLSSGSAFTGGAVLNGSGISVVNINNAASLGASAGTVTISSGSIDNTSGASITTVSYPLSIGGSFTFVGSNDLNFGTGATALTASSTITTTAGNLTLGGAISGSSSSLTKAGAGTLILSGSNSYGATNITAGILQVGNGGTSGTLGTSTVSDGALLSFNESGNLTVGNTLQDYTSGSTTTSGQVVQNGSGVLTLTGTNTFTGGLTVNSGTVAVASSTYLGPTTEQTTINNGGTVSFTDSGTLAPGTGRTFLLGGGLDTINVANSSATITQSGVVSGSTGTLVKTGAGTLALTAANSYYATTLNSGTVSIAQASSLPGAVNFTGNATLTANSTTGAISLTNTVGSIPTGVTAAFANTGLLTNGAGAFVISSQLSGGGNVQVSTTSYSTAGSVELSNDSNSFSGTFTTLNGLIQYTSVANSGSVSSLGAGTTAYNLNAGTSSNLTFQYLGSNSTSTDRAINWGGISTSGVLALDSSGSGSVSFLSSSNIRSGGTAALQLTLQGTNTLSNTLAQTINDSNGFATSLAKSGAGTWVISGNNTFTGNTTVNAGILDLANANAVQNSTLTTNSTSGTVQFDSSAGTSFIAGGLAGSAPLVLQTNATTPSAVALTVGSNGVSTSYSGVLSGTGSLIKNGLGTLKLTNTNTYSGDTTINAGTLQLGDSSGSGSVSSTSTVSIASGATLAYSRSTTSVTATPTITGSGNFVQQGTSTDTVYLTGNDNSGFTGTETISSGSLEFTDAANLGATTATLNIGAGSLYYNAASTTPLALSANRTINFTDAASSVNVITNDTLSFVGAIGGSGGLTKSGAGTVALSGNNIYGGATTINAGTLQANTSTAGQSATSAGAVTIATGGTLAGGTNAAPGLVAGTVAVSGKITAGTGATSLDTIGSLTTGAQTWFGGGTYNAKISGASNDLLTMSGLTIDPSTATTANPFKVTLVGLSATSITAPVVIALDQNTLQTNVFQNAINALTLTYTIPSNITGDSSGLQLAELDTSGGEELVLESVDSTPEPTSAILLGLAAMPILAERRRRRAVAVAEV